MMLLSTRSVFRQTRSVNGKPSLVNCLSEDRTPKELIPAFAGML
jgi:hypothetical protein